jgi:hypothetical protein
MHGTFLSVQSLVLRCSPSGGWWGSRTRLEVALLAMVAVSLFLLVAVCLAMAAVIAGSSPNSLFAGQPSVY